MKKIINFILNIFIVFSIICAIACFVYGIAYSVNKFLILYFYIAACLAFFFRLIKKFIAIKKFNFSITLVLFFSILVFTGILEYINRNQLPFQDQQAIDSAIMDCSVYNIAYNDALQNKVPLIGEFMAEEKQEDAYQDLLSNNANINSITFNKFILAYRLGYEDAKDGKENQVEDALQNIINKYPEREGEIRKNYKIYHQKLKKDLEKIRGLPRGILLVKKTSVSPVIITGDFLIRKLQNKTTP